MKKIFGIFVISLLIILASSIAFAVECSDTDGGLNYDTKGKVSYNGYDYEDYCATPGTATVLGELREFKEGDLLEYSCYGISGESLCTTTACKYVQYSCPNGCDNGACIQEETSEGCTDTDGGKNYNVKGVLNSQYEDTYPPVKEDLCFNEIQPGQEDLFHPKTEDGNTLLEYYCYEFETGDYLVDYYTCPNGCKNGACVEKEKFCGNHICEDGETIDTPTFCPEDCDHCVDTDGGDDLFTYGVVTYNWEETIPDRCAKDTELGKSRPELKNTIYESFCANERGTNTGGAGTKNRECELGCENGVCLKKKVSYSTCVDTDNGMSPNVQGTTKYLEMEKMDACIDATRGLVRECSGKDCNLHEFYCNEGNQGLTPDEEITFDSIKCPIGCRDGACIECEGCLRGDKCYEVGTVVSSQYCNEDQSFQNLKEIGANCINDYECEINRCDEGICRPECDGCFEDNKCLPYGTRKNSEYCSLSKQMESYKENGATCDNNYECGSNLCIDNECVEAGLFQKIVNWFKSLFGGE